MTVLTEWQPRPGRLLVGEGGIETWASLDAAKSIFARRTELFPRSYMHVWYDDGSGAMAHEPDLTLRVQACNRHSF